MQIYLACVGMMCETYDHIRDKFCPVGQPSLVRELRSFAETKLRWHTGHTIVRYSDDFFLDSGAFTAYSSAMRGDGKIITREEYAHFLRRFSHQCNAVANLDDIPQSRTAEGLRTSAVQSMRNQLFIERETGFRPIPVFHKGEPWDFLDFYVANYDYICLGGLVADSKAGGNDEFFEDAWPRIVDKNGKPRCKVHGFGMTSLPAMLKYPWWSVDSSAWLIQSQFGNIYVPRKHLLTGEYDYSAKPNLVAMSSNSSNQQYHGWHWKTLAKEQRALVLEYVEKRGYDVKKLEEYADWRFSFNLMYWSDLERSAKWATTFRQTQMSLI